MTYFKLNVVSAIGGAVAGIALFGLVYLARDAFAAAEDLGSMYIAGRAGSIVVVPGLVVGLGLAFLADEAIDEGGLRLVPPLVLFTLFTGAAAIALAHRIAPEMAEVMINPTLSGTVTMAITAGVRGWINA